MGVVATLNYYAGHVLPQGTVTRLIIPPSLMMNLFLNQKPIEVLDILTLAAPL